MKYKSNPFIRSTLTLAAAMGLGAAAHAGIITFGAATTISGDTNVSTVGTAAYAYALSNTTKAVNGVTFTGSDSKTDLGTNVSMSGFTANNTSAFKGTTSGTWNGLTANYKATLQGANYGSTAAATVTLNNLTSGHVYATQIWVNDSRSDGSGRTETVYGGGNTVTLDYNNTNAVNGVGQFTIGRFASDATTQAFTLKGSASTQMNAIQLRDVTNIGNWVGTGGATWDSSSTNNFASNVFSAALTSTTFATAKTPLSSVTFADSYWNSGVATTVSQTSVTVGAGGVSTGTVYFDNSAVNYTIGSADATGITGSTAMIKTGAGSVTFNGTNTYSGATTVYGGTLKVSSGGVINNAATSGGIGSITGGSTLDIDGGTVNFNGGTALVVGDDTTAGNVIVRAGSNLNLTGAIAIGQGSATGNTPVSTFTQTGGTTTIGTSSTLYLGNYRGATMDIQGGSLASASAANIGVRGNSTLTISGISTEVAFTHIAMGNVFGADTATSDVNLNGGTLTLGASGFITAATSGAKTVNFDGGTLKASATSADFVNATSVYVKAGGATIDTNTFDVTIDNALLQSGATTGALTKSGAGSLTLSGTNTYTGNTTVSAGNLVINGSISNSALTTIASGARLQGAGAVGNLDVQGFVAPGNSIESLGAGDITFQANSIFEYELDSSVLNGDLLDGSGSLTIYSGATLSLSQLASGTLLNDSKLTLISYAGAWNNVVFKYNSNDLADDESFTLGSNTWRINYNDTSGGINFTLDQSTNTAFVTLTVIPEPRAALLGGLGLLALLRRRRD